MKSLADGRMQERQRVLAAIDEQRLTRMVQELVKIPSNNPPGEEKEVAEFLVTYLDNIGLKVEWREVLPDRPNVIATLGSGKRPCLILNGHTDVIPAGEGWDVEPFSGAVIDGKIYGRGSADMKGGLAAMVMAVEAIKRVGVDLKGNVKITAVMGEEDRQLGTKALIEDGIEADYAIVGEPTELKIAISHKGVSRFEMKTVGKAAHGSRPEEGVNAIYAMCDVIASLWEFHDKLKARQDELLGSGTINVGTIHGGLNTCIVPDSCTITIDRRVLPGEHNEDIEKELLELLEGLKARGALLDFSLTPISICSPMKIAEDEVIVKAIQAAARELLGQNMGVHGFSALCDANLLVNARGIPTAIFGPGSLALAHRPNEYVEIAEVVTAARIYALAILSLLA